MAIASNTAMHRKVMFPEIISVSTMSKLSHLASGMGMNEKKNFIDAIENFANGQVRVGDTENAEFYFKALQSLLDFFDSRKSFFGE